MRHFRINLSLNHKGMLTKKFSFKQRYHWQNSFVINFYVSLNGSKHKFSASFAAKIWNKGDLLTPPNNDL